MTIDTLDYQAREAKVIEAIKAGAKPSTEVATELVAAKLDMKRRVVGDSLGGLFGPDSLSDEAMKAGDRYERALAALETELGL